WLRSAALVLSALVPSAYWYGRNVLLTGNPLYPAHVEVLGWTIWPGWYPRSAMRTSPYYFSGRDLGFLIDTVFTVFDLRMLPLWLGALGGLWAVRRSDRRPEDRWVWGLSALAILNLALFWVVIPYRTQQRFMFPAVALAAIPLARLLDRSSLLRWLAVGLLALHLLTPWDWPFFPHLSRYTPRSAPLTPIPTSFPELLARLRDPRRSLHLIPIFVVGPLTPGCVFFWARWWRSRSLGRLLSAAFTLLLIAVLSVVGNLPPSLTHWPVFPYFPQYLRAWQAVNYFSGPQGATIAYAGTDIPYYLFGSDLKNNVVYVNIDDHPSWLMHDYHRTASERGEPVLWETSRPGWGRLNADINAWVQNLADAQVDYLVVARCRPEQGPFNIADEEGFPY
ncbi:MAG TPA: 4-amino-4-deoxy-L-arabinose transferase, partial [Isosphaeraceae bacterium]|nr:4-amino-4-deoxy-L-arabinose transferase [Isosphaeraceae bacterium]